MELQAINTFNSANRLGSDASRLSKVGKDFEAMFMYQVLELMQPKVDEDSLFSGGEGERMFKQILNEKIAAEITERGSLGIKKSVETQIERYRKASK